MHGLRCTVKTLNDVILWYKKVIYTNYLHTSVQVNNIRGKLFNILKLVIL